MPAAKSHFVKKVKQPDRRRDEQRRPQQGADIGRPAGMQVGEDVLDMDDAGNVVQRVAPDRKPAVVRRRHLGNDLGKALGHADRDDIGARDHHIRGVQVTQPEDVAQQGAFMRVETGAVGAAVGKQCFKLVPPRRGRFQRRKHHAEKFADHHPASALST